MSEKIKDEQGKNNRVKELLKAVKFELGERIEFDLDMLHIMLVVSPSKITVRHRKKAGLAKFFGVWKDERTAEEIIKDIRSRRKNAVDISWDDV